MSIITRISDFCATCAHHIASHANYGSDNPDSHCVVEKPKKCDCTEFVPKQYESRDPYKDNPGARPMPHLGSQ